MDLYEMCFVWLMLVGVGARANFPLKEVIGSKAFDQGGQLEQTGTQPRYFFGKDESFAPKRLRRKDKSSSEKKYDGTVACEEVQGGSKEDVVCYRCKDRRNGSTYERCFDAGQASTRHRRSRAPFSRLADPYRFADEVFSDASHEISAKYKKEAENCEKVIEDSMVCLVCKDAKTNGKYKQCSYVAQPSEVSSSKSPYESHRGTDRDYNADCTFHEKDGQNCKVCKDPKTGDTSENCMYVFPTKKKAYSYTASGKYQGPPETRENAESPERDEESSASTDDCKKVEKNGQTCTVCKSAKNDDEYERCSYSSVPNDKVYKFTKSKSYGQSQPSGKYSYDKSGEASQTDDSGPRHARNEDYRSDYSYPETSYRGSSYRDDPDSYSRYDSGDYKSASERAAERIQPSNCQQVERDGMTCTVCKDPKTGGNSEQCSYAFKPKDKVFSYSKSRSIGNPTEDRSSGSNYETSESKSRPPSSAHRRISEDDAVGDGYFQATEKKAEIEKILKEFQQEDRRKCEKIIRDKMSCYRCVDEQGYQKEECVFVGAQEPKRDKKPEKRGAVDSTFLEPVVAATVTESVTETVAVADDEEKSAGESGVEAEPYQYALETKPVYDKILGLTLPQYMLTPSEHEKAFDEAVESFYEHR